MKRRQLIESIIHEFNYHTEGDIPLSEEDINWLTNSPVDSSLKIYRAIKDRHPGTYLHTLYTGLNRHSPFSDKYFPHYLQLSEKILEIIRVLETTDKGEKIDLHLVTPLKLGFEDSPTVDQFFHRAHQLGFISLDLQAAILSATKPHQLYNWSTFAMYEQIQSLCFHDKDGKHILDVREVKKSEHAGINTRWIFARRH